MRLLLLWLCIILWRSYCFTLSPLIPLPLALHQPPQPPFIFFREPFELCFRNRFSRIFQNCFGSFFFCSLIAHLGCFIYCNSNKKAMMSYESIKMTLFISSCLGNACVLYIAFNLWDSLWNILNFPFNFHRPLSSNPASQNSTS